MLKLPRELFQNENFSSGGVGGAARVPNFVNNVSCPENWSNGGFGGGLGGGLGGGFGNVNPLALLVLGYLAGRYWGPSRQPVVPLYYIVDGRSS